MYEWKESIYEKVSENQSERKNEKRNFKKFRNFAEIANGAESGKVWIWESERNKERDQNYKSLKVVISSLSHFFFFLSYYNFTKHFTRTF